MGKDLQEGKLKPNDLSEGYIRETYQTLNESAGAGYGKNWNTSDGGGLLNPRIQKMKQNIYKFSAAKSASVLTDLNQRLYKDGKLIPLKDFEREIEALNLQYNKNWLNAEYNTAKQSSYMAQKWESIESNTKLYPNLKYKTQGDSRVRPEHEALDGIIAPVNDPFWSKYYPPNGWRCRCDVVQTAEKPTKELPKQVPGVKPEFEINIGQSGQIYKEESKNEHPYFALAKSNPDWKKRFELSKQSAGFEKAHTATNGAKVEVNIYADEKDLPKNLRLAKLMADQLEMSMKIPAHVDLPNIKNPELLHKGIKGDVVSPKKNVNVKRATDNLFKNKLSKSHNGQLSDEKNTFLAIDIWFEINEVNTTNFISQSWSKFNYYTQLDFIVLINENQALKIDRSITKSDYTNYKKQVETFLSNKRPKK